VVESLANQYGVSQSAIMDTGLTGGDMAVRLAIGESQVIQENKDFFSSHGVDLNALESLNSAERKQSGQRSTTTLLIKNLPTETVADELESMFARFGELSSFLVPKSKTVALVDFVEPSEARAAFKGLAYRRYKNSPLYLEWAPLGLIDLKKATATTANKPAASSSSSSSANNQEPSSSTTTADNLEEFSSLFIKNLNFSTSEEALKAHVLRLGVQGLRTVVIQKKFKGSSVLSQGFGFVEFRNAHFAQDALQRLDGSLLDSHKLEVKASDKRLTAAPAAEVRGHLDKSKQSSKLVVRNLAFQATKTELRQLFSAFGTVKTVRIPKKMGGNHRGFAFVDFATGQEAANAMAALKNTHLYGRHLVIEWAKAEDDDNGDGEDAEEKAARKRAVGDAKVLNAVNQKNKRQRTSATGEEEDPDMKDLI
jgi:multiple RNA-binding domain-containing protein 1